MRILRYTTRKEDEAKVSFVTTTYEFHPIEALNSFIQLSGIRFAPIDNLMIAIQWSFHKWTMTIDWPK